jgi:hypothetical protein
VTGDGCREVVAETSDEPSAGGDGAVGAKPQMGVKGKDVVAKSEIMYKGSEWVIDSVGFLDYNAVPLEKTVCLVAR